MTGNTLADPTDLMTHLRVKQQKQLLKIKNNYLDKSAPINTRIKPDFQSLASQKNSALYKRCDEFDIYGIYDAEIQQIFPFYATSSGDTQLPIACMKRDAELIISPNTCYIGLYDGYLNDNLKSFSVKLKSSETWIYTNGDCADAHSLHFHLTSGFASPQSNYNSPGLISYKRGYDSLIYSRDIYQIGPQETVSFNLTWPHYSSYDRTKEPAFRCIGGVIHCHFLQHNDANSMIISYFVDRESDQENSPKSSHKQILPPVPDLDKNCGCCSKKD